MDESVVMHSEDGVYHDLLSWQDIFGFESYREKVTKDGRYAEMLLTMKLRRQCFPGSMEFLGYDIFWPDREYALAQLDDRL